MYFFLTNRGSPILSNQILRIASSLENAWNEISALSVELLLQPDIQQCTIFLNNTKQISYFLQISINLLNSFIHFKLTLGVLVHTWHPDLSPFQISGQSFPLKYMSFISVCTIGYFTVAIIKL